jgi:hypothetical protein
LTSNFFSGGKTNKFKYFFYPATKSKIAYKRNFFNNFECLNEFICFKSLSLVVGGKTVFTLGNAKSIDSSENKLVFSQEEVLQTVCDTKQAVQLFCTFVQMKTFN